uniref:Uncharacterized protein n=1 Tax=Bubo bubo TaxID=30461 RepID=A0A8C0EJN1_BUBBB
MELSPSASCPRQRGLCRVPPATLPGGSFLPAQALKGLLEASLPPHLRLPTAPLPTIPPQLPHSSQSKPFSSQRRPQTLIYPQTPPWPLIPPHQLPSAPACPQHMLSLPHRDLKQENRDLKLENLLDSEDMKVSIFFRRVVLQDVSAALLPSFVADPRSAGVILYALLPRFMPSSATNLQRLLCQTQQPPVFPRRQPLPQDCKVLPNQKVLRSWLAGCHISSMHWCLGFNLPTCRTLHVPLLNFMRLISPAWPVTSEQQDNHLIYQPLLPVFDHLQTRGGCALTHHLCH